VKRWEYYTVVHRFDESPNLYLPSLLKDLGVEGWELVTCLTSEPPPAMTLIFKRPLRSQKEAGSA